MTANDDRPITFRHELRPGDLGWVVGRHGVLYAEEFGWDATFEAVAAEIVARLGQPVDPVRERAWLAEQDERLVGCVFLERQSDEVAKLRLLLVEPEARGVGLGSRLVRECVAFARQAGYRRVRLWTMSVLLPARRIYERCGFRLVDAEPCRRFGHEMVSETWELEL
jgi:N-acetylglutamate synthase-like GNAT family acetyltransferase